ncbi:MAG: LuxR C-terminal-related transcriptional regulator [Armatimonadota bacterium]|nr:LuxR C-terminal-related transcriptional regulator [Armatimonadota bacterium]
MGVKRAEAVSSARRVSEGLRVALEALERAGEPALVVDGRQRIILWNRAAEKLLGWSQEEVVGRPCYRVVAGYDRNGHLVCCPGCPEFAMARAEETIPPRDVCYRTRDGRYVWVNTSTLVLRPGPDPQDVFLVHLFRDVTRQRTVEELVELLAAREGLLATVGAVKHPLTRREREVLSLLAQGMDTQAIARALVLSTATVRNHVQNLLRKLGAHTRAEAVARALQQGLFPRDGKGLHLHQEK